MNRESPEEQNIIVNVNIFIVTGVVRFALTREDRALATRNAATIATRL